MLAPRCVIVPAKLRAQRKQVETWQSSELMDFNAKVVIYEALVEEKSKPQRMSSHIQLTQPVGYSPAPHGWRLPFSCPKKLTQILVGQLFRQDEKPFVFATLARTVGFCQWR